jgi:hypothetical protein
MKIWVYGPFAVGSIAWLGVAVEFENAFDIGKRLSGCPVFWIDLKGSLKAFARFGVALARA